jgi:UDP-2-acetamido-3-amino-2,3-dideoxy-glucuronate N-acetyltransferase
MLISFLVPPPLLAQRPLLPSRASLSRHWRQRRILDGGTEGTMRRSESSRRPFLGATWSLIRAGESKESNVEFVSIADDVILGKDVKIYRFVNLYGCQIGDECRIGTFVEIQKGAIIGRRCKISSHTFICEGVQIGDGCFIGHGVVFINDRHPRAVTSSGQPESEEDWSNRFVATKVGDRVSIGSGAIILGGITLGEGAVIGAGAVVTRDVAPNEVVAGVPARVLGRP